MKFLTALSVSFLIVLHSLIAVAGPIDDAREAFKRRDYQAALKLYRPLAESGDRESQFQLGLIYNSGYGVKIDNTKAREWWGKAAEQGVIGAQFNLGNLYKHGLGGPVDYRLAAHWFRKAADQGSASAQYELGYLFGTGKGVPQDQAESFFWYGLAANSGVSQAVFSGIDPIVARDEAKQHLTSKQIDAVQKRTQEWKATPATTSSCKGGAPVIQGVVYSGADNWLVWINGQKVTPTESMKEIYSIEVTPNQVRMKWFDVCQNKIIDITMKPNESWIEPVPAKPSKVCITADDCKDFCEGAGNGKECLPDGMPVCEKNVCSCVLTCR